MARELFTHGFDECRLIHRLGADDHPLHPRIQVGLNNFRATDTATNLDRQVRVGLGNRLDDFAIHRLTGKGPVQVDQMQAASATFHPMTGNGNRVVGEHGVVFHTALLEAYTFTVFQVDGGNQ